MIHKIYEKNPYIEKDGILLIPLDNKNNTSKEYAKVSIEDKYKLLKYCYTTHKGRNTNYVKNNYGKLIHGLVIEQNIPDGYQIDHIDRDGLNNTRENLRVITGGANRQNVAKKEGCSSKYTGVSLSDGKWKVGISIKHKAMYLGSFDKEEEAGKMYDVYAIKHYGIKCMTNNLLSEDEINDIAENGIPNSWKVKNKKLKIDKDLPKHITREGKKYKVGFFKKDLNFRKVVETLEEAIILRDKTLLKYKENKNKKENERRKNIIRNSEGYPIIQLKNKNKKIVCEIIVDDHVWGYISSMSWSLINKYAHSSTIDSDFLMHRYIYEKYVGKIPDGKSIDHKDSTRIFDNRICNLRPAGASLQNHNKEKDKNSVDKYKGVYFVKGSYTTIVNKKTYGCYETAEEAADKANEIFREIYGKDARQNEIDFSVKTTKDNRIKEEEITEEYINNIKLVKNLRNIIMLKKLNYLAGGPIKVNDIKEDNIEEFKTEVIKKLFKEMCGQKEEINEDYIMNIRNVKELKKFITSKKLNTSSNGPISVNDVNKDNLNKVKMIVIGLLFKGMNVNEIDYSFKIIQIKEKITEKYIMNIRSVNDLKKIIKLKKLNGRNLIKIDSIKLSNLDEFKIKVVDLLLKNSELEEEIEEENKEKKEEEYVTEEYIMNIKNMIDLKKIINLKKLNFKCGGPIKIRELKKDNLDKFKTIVIGLLFNKSN